MRRPDLRHPSPAIPAAGWPTSSACSRCTRTPTTKRRRARARPPSTRPKACATCSCAAPAARRATSSIPRSTHPGRAATSHDVRMAELARERRALGYARCTCSDTATAGCPTPRPTRGPTTSPTRRSTKRSERLVRIIRAERPQVIITYRDDRNFYPHPDHIRVHEISGPRVRRRGRSRGVPRRRGAVAAVEALLRVVVDRAGEGAARGVPRAGRGEPVRVVVRSADSMPIAKSDSRP